MELAAKATKPGRTQGGRYFEDHGGPMRRMRWGLNTRNLCEYAKIKDILRFCISSGFLFCTYAKKTK